MEPATPAGLYLGCRHEVSSVHGRGYRQTLMAHNMEGFLESCVKRYEELPGGNARLHAVNMPFLPEDPKEGPAGKPRRLGAITPSPLTGTVFEALTPNARHSHVLLVLADALGQTRRRSNNHWARYSPLLPRSS